MGDGRGAAQLRPAAPPHTNHLLLASPPQQSAPADPRHMQKRSRSRAFLAKRGVSQSVIACSQDVFSARYYFQYAERWSVLYTSPHHGRSVNGCAALLRVIVGSGHDFDGAGVPLEQQCYAVRGNHAAVLGLVVTTKCHLTMHRGWHHSRGSFQTLPSSYCARWSAWMTTM